MSEERILPTSVRLNGVLLRAYPERFRRDYGPQTEQLFLDLYREQRGGRIGHLLLWIRTLSDLVPAVVAQRIMPRTNHREAVIHGRRPAVIGLVLLLAPLYFVGASLLKYGLGVGLFFDPMEALLSVSGRREIFNLVSPVVFLGGLCLAVALNVFAVTWFDVGREDWKFVGTVRVTP